MVTAALVEAEAAAAKLRLEAEVLSPSFVWKLRLEAEAAAGVDWQGRRAVMKEAKAELAEEMEETVVGRHSSSRIGNCSPRPEAVDK